jgi:hypothetical protein
MQQTRHLGCPLARLIRGSTPAQVLEIKTKQRPNVRLYASSTTTPSLVSNTALSPLTAELSLSLSLLANVTFLGVAVNSVLNGEACDELAWLFCCQGT